MGYYYGSLVYKNMRSFPDDKLFGEGMVTVSGREFFRTAIQLCKTFCSSDGQLCTDWLLPAKFNTFRFMDDPRSGEENVFEGGNAVAS